MLNCKSGLLMQRTKEYEVHSEKGGSDTSMRVVVWCPATQHMFSGDSHADPHANAFEKV